MIHQIIKNYLANSIQNIQIKISIMKNIITVFSLILFFSACTPEENINSNPIVGEWQLAETLMDPGDGSGTFQPVTSNKTITFAADSTWESNGKFCNASIANGTNSQGTYSLSQKLLYTTGCTAWSAQLSFELNNNNDELIINFQCIEPCAQKYFKVVNK